MFYPNKKKFKELIKNGYTAQLWKEISAAGETPVSAYLKLGTDSPSCLLESVEGTEKFARYSFLVLSPSTIFKSTGKFVKIKTIDGEKNIKTDDPLEYLKSVLSENKILHNESLPRLSGGAIGYIAYDYVKNIEKIPDCGRKGLSLPELYFIFPKIIVVFDHLRQKLKIIRLIKPSEKTGYKTACNEIDEIIKKLSEP